MLSIVLCAGAFLLCFMLGRRSLVSGLIAVIGVGYFYGIVRANVGGALSYFIFDAAVVGLYATQLLRPLSPDTRARVQPLIPWLVLLIGLPALFLLVPLQDPMVRLVGLRAHVLFLPFLLFGARLERADVHRLVSWFAVFNVVALGFAVMQFVLGVERFFPRTEATELIYRSRDVQTGGLAGAFRIPSTFGNAALYGAAMVITLPFMLGRWLQRSSPPLERLLLGTAIFASVLGVFFSATRVNFLILVILLLVTLVSGKLGAGIRVGAAVMIAAVAWVVTREERLFQRILTLNWDAFAERIAWSLNESLIAFLFQFPFGNGLGGGGTNMPYFLEHLVRDRQAIENHYGTVLLELGIPGLFIWLCFIAWVLARRTASRDDPWFFGKRLLRTCIALFFVQAMIGVGLLSALPFSVIFLLGIGWLVVRQPPVEGDAESADERFIDDSSADLASPIAPQASVLPRQSSL